MAYLLKPFYHIDEVLTRWSMSERDVMSFVLSGALTVSATVAGLRVTYGLCRPSAAGTIDRLATDHRHIIGLVQLQPSDAWRILRHGEFTITALQAPAEQFAMIDNAAGNHQQQVLKADLVIDHDELVRFERAHVLFQDSEAIRDVNRRGAPSKYEWDDIWVELCAMIFLEGLPETQAALVQHVVDLLAAKGKPVPDESTIKKKIKPLWRRLRPAERIATPANA